LTAASCLGEIPFLTPGEAELGALFEEKLELALLQRAIGL
jgi:hypothetical protein